MSFQSQRLKNQANKCRLNHFPHQLFVKPLVKNSPACTSGTSLKNKKKVELEIRLPTTKLLNTKNITKSQLIFRVVRKDTTCKTIKMDVEIFCTNRQEVNSICVCNDLSKNFHSRERKNCNGFRAKSSSILRKKSNRVYLSALLNRKFTK